MTARAAERSVRIEAVIGNASSTSNVTRDMAAIPVLSLALNSSLEVPTNMASSKPQLASVSSNQLMTLIVNFYVAHSVAGRAMVTAAA